MRLSKARLRLVGAAGLKLSIPVAYSLLLIPEVGFFFNRYAGFGFDARIYVRAASEWLSGGDPWSVSIAGVGFVAPPPSLLPFAPFTMLPESITSVVWVGSSLAAALFAIRRVGLPLYWLLWPPLLEGIWVGNPNVVVLAFLLLPLGDTPAAFLKIYAIVPSILLGRWRNVALTLIALFVTAPALPWASFLADWPRIIGDLARQAGPSLNGWVSPLLFVAATIALALTVRRPWFAVPTLWPSIQAHYGVLALPAASGLYGVIAALPIAGAFAWAAIAVSLRDSWKRGRGVPDNPQVLA